LRQFSSIFREKIATYRKHAIKFCIFDGFAIDYIIG